MFKFKKKKSRIDRWMELDEQQTKQIGECIELIGSLQKRVNLLMDNDESIGRIVISQKQAIDNLTEQIEELRKLVNESTEESQATLLFLWKTLNEDLSLT